jgi:hypothetical protein
LIALTLPILAWRPGAVADPAQRPPALANTGLKAHGEPTRGFSNADDWKLKQ